MGFDRGCDRGRKRGCRLSRRSNACRRRSKRSHAGENEFSRRQYSDQRGRRCRSGIPCPVKMGIKDSPQMMAEDLIRAGKTVDKERVRFLAQNALSTWKWTQEKWGTRWNPDKLQFDEGQSVPRGCSAFLDQVLLYFHRVLSTPETLTFRSAITVWSKTYFSDPTGEAQGLLVRTRYKFPDPASGTQIKIRARRAIVLCFGGFRSRRGI